MSADRASNNRKPGAGFLNFGWGDYEEEKDEPSAPRQAATHDPNHESGGGKRGEWGVSRMPDSSGAPRQAATHVPNHERKCRWGENCKNSTCSFLHPRQIDCRWEDCTNERCPYKHPGKKSGALVLAGGKDSRNGSMGVRCMDISNMNERQIAVQSRKKQREARLDAIDAFIMFLSVRVEVDKGSSLDFTEFVHRTVVNGLLNRKDDDPNISTIQTQLKFAIGVGVDEHDLDTQNTIVIMLRSSLASYSALNRKSNWRRQKDYDEYMAFCRALSKLCGR